MNLGNVPSSKPDPSAISVAGQNAEETLSSTTGPKLPQLIDINYPGVALCRVPDEISSIDSVGTLREQAKRLGYNTLAIECTTEQALELAKHLDLDARLAPYRFVRPSLTENVTKVDTNVHHIYVSTDSDSPITTGDTTKSVVAYLRSWASPADLASTIVEGSALGIYRPVTLENLDHDREVKENRLANRLADAIIDKSSELACSLTKSPEGKGTFDLKKLSATLEKLGFGNADLTTSDSVSNVLERTDAYLNPLRQRLRVVSRKLGYANGDCPSQYQSSLGHYIAIAALPLTVAATTGISWLLTRSADFTGSAAMMSVMFGLIAIPFVGGSGKLYDFIAARNQRTVNQLYNDDITLNEPTSQDIEKLVQTGTDLMTGDFDPMTKRQRVLSVLYDNLEEQIEPVQAVNEELNEYRNRLRAKENQRERKALAAQIMASDRIDGTIDDFSFPQEDTSSIGVQFDLEKYLEHLAEGDTPSILGDMDEASRSVVDEIRALSPELVPAVANRVHQRLLARRGATN